MKERPSRLTRDSGQQNYFNVSQSGEDYVIAGDTDVQVTVYEKNTHLWLCSCNVAFRIILVCNCR